jgi:hypothetical protein
VVPVIQGWVQGFARCRETTGLPIVGLAIAAALFTSKTTGGNALLNSPQKPPRELHDDNERRTSMFRALRLALALVSLATVYALAGAPAGSAIATPQDPCESATPPAFCEGDPQPPPPPPAPAPTGLQTAARTQTTITLSWIDNATTEVAYQIYHADGGYWRRLVTLPANPGTGRMSYTIGDLVSNTPYSFRVEASVGGMYNGGPTISTGTLPDPPTDFRRSAGSQDYLVWEWNPPGRADLQRIQLWDVAGTLLKTADLGPTVKRWVSGDLQQQTRYCASVTSYGPAGGSVESARVCAWTAAPPPPPPPTPDTPTILRAEPGDTSITVTWSDVASEAEYTLEWSTNQWAWWSKTLGANTTSWTVTGLGRDETWCFRVTASNAGGRSAPSQVVCASTGADPDPPPALPNLYVGDIYTTKYGDPSQRFDNIRAGEKFTIAWEVCNGGNAAAGAHVNRIARAGYDPFAERTLASLAVGPCVRQYVNIDGGLDAGQYSFDVGVDDDNDVVESFELDNIRRLNFNILSNT